ncbi:MAG: ABC transporter ATP-binding protein [Brevinemataceae bacterium]
MLAELKDIVKKIPDGSYERTLLENVSLNIEENEVVALVGTSGSGKTALLRILACLEGARKGTYLFNNNIHVVNMSQSALANMRRKYMGFIGFEPEFLENMTVQECLSMPLSALSIPAKNQRSQMIDILESLGMVSKLSAPIHKLQYYERMYISAARAFIKKPLLVVADEPGKQLHSNEAVALFDALLALRKEIGGTLVYTTYDPAHLKKADRVVYMKNGRIVKTEEH